MDDQDCRMMMDDHNKYSDMTTEELHNLFIDGQIHPNSDEGRQAIKELASRDRIEKRQVKKVAYWVIILALIVATGYAIKFILSFG